MKRVILYICLLLLTPWVCTAKEVRGIWLRPPENPGEITRIFDELSSAGFNLVLVETFYHGFTIYPSQLAPQRPEYQGKDVLKLCVEEAHRRGLQLHCWIEAFYWQVDTEKFPRLPRTTLFDRHPEWLLRLRDGSTTEKTEFAHLFANPAHPAVRAFVVNLIKEIISTYPVDGINLDYIRYPAGEHDAGYDEFSRAEYKKRSGIDPLTIEKNKDSQKWQDWVEWREQQVSKLVEAVSQLLKKHKSQVTLSAAVFTNYYQNRYLDFHLQDWQEWAKQGWVDWLIPMAYATSMAGIKDAVDEMLQRVAGTQVTVIPALAAPKPQADRYGSPDRPLVPEQIKMVRTLTPAGHTIFCYGWMKDRPGSFGQLRREAYGQITSSMR